MLLNGGDISACSTTGAAQTAQIVAREPGTVMAGGDLTDSGTADQLANCYDPTWGSGPRVRVGPGGVSSPRRTSAGR
ncbi:hypothetical protein ACQP0I_01710 [Micromonospora carbonacea]|uniref:hypothetical protein n=1 Tax=Micromonospora carbonacea TaxID=47853 RepID=UPI003D98C5B4